MIKIVFDVEVSKWGIHEWPSPMARVYLSAVISKKRVSTKMFTIPEYENIKTIGSKTPVVLIDHIKGKIWLYKDVYFYENEKLSSDDFALLANDLLYKRSKKLERAKALTGGVPANTVKRNRIPDDIKIFVWKRDGGKCVKCGSGADLEFDHIIPISMGGSNSARNLQLLCGSCNRAKGGNLV